MTEVPGDDYHRYLRILKLTGDRCSHSDAPSYDTSARSPSGDENAEGTPPSNVLSAKHAIYLGQLELERDHVVRPNESGCKLIVIDLASAEDCSESGGYLRVFVIDEANITDPDGQYLNVLDF